jgi:hypothetical protein
MRAGQRGNRKADDGMGLAGKREVVAVAAATGEQSRVLEPRQGSADAVGHLRPPVERLICSTISRKAGSPEEERCRQ